MYPTIYNSFQLFEPQLQKKSPFLRTTAFIFLFAWGRPCGNHAKRCMNAKSIQCLPNPSQHVSIYLQQFPSYSNRKCNRRFHAPQPTFLFPLETPVRLSRNMLHGWKDNSMLAKPLAACTCLSSIVSELYELKSMRKSKNRNFYHIFVFPGDAPSAVTLNVVWVVREFDAYKLSRCMCPSNYNHFYDTARYL